MVLVVRDRVRGKRPRSVKLRRTNLARTVGHVTSRYFIGLTDIARYDRAIPSAIDLPRISALARHSSSGIQQDNCTAERVRNGSHGGVFLF